MSEQDIREQLTALEREIGAAERQEAALRRELEHGAPKASATADPLDAFMSSNTATVRGNRLAECQAEQARLRQEHAHASRLLRMVIPALAPMAPAAAAPAAAAAAPAAAAAAAGPRVPLLLSPSVLGAG